MGAIGAKRYTRFVRVNPIGGFFFFFKKKKSTIFIYLQVLLSIMKSTISIDQENIIYTALLDTNEKEIDEWTSSLHAIIKQQFEKEGPVHVLTDLTHISFADSFRIRKLISEMEKKNEPYVLKSAAFTPDIRIRWLSIVLAKMSGRKDFAAFSTKEKALAWLHIPDKNQVLQETFYLVYTHLKENPNADEVDVFNYVRKIRNYTNNDGEVSIDLFNIQQGTVYVTFHYLKENPIKKREEALKDIEENYSELLNKYYLLET
jgi:hypothetical protein